MTAMGMGVKAKPRGLGRSEERAEGLPPERGSAAGCGGGAIRRCYATSTPARKEPATEDGSAATWEELVTTERITSLMDQGRRRLGACEERAAAMCRRTGSAGWELAA